MSTPILQSDSIQSTEQIRSSFPSLDGPHGFLAYLMAQGNTNPRVVVDAWPTSCIITAKRMGISEQSRDDAIMNQRDRRLPISHAYRTKWCWANTTTMIYTLARAGARLGPVLKSSPELEQHANIAP